MRTFIRALIFLLIFGVCAPLFAQQWNEVRSPNFVVLTDGKISEGRDVALRFEQMRGLFGAIFHRTKVNLTVPLTIIAFRNGRELRENGPIFNGKTVELAGYFQMGEDRNFIALDLSAPNGWDTVFHEYAHLLLNSNYPATQPWFDEGFAEYYSSMKIGKEVEIGYPPKSAAIFSQSTNLIPVVDLFSVGHDSKVYNESGDRRSLFYAQSWLVMHWIFDNHKLPEAAKYFELVKVRKTPIPDAITQAFGVPPKQFDRILSDYLRAGRGNVTRMPLPVSVDPATFTADKVSDVRARAVLADLHLHMRERREQAVGEFQKILEEDPNNETAQKGLAFSYIWKRDLDNARPHLQRAVELNSRDPRVHYYLAVVLNQGSQTAVEADSGVQSIIFELQKAIDLDPQYADAFNLLAYMQMRLNKPEDAVKNMRQAVALSPRNEMYRLNFAQMLIANNQLDDAKNLLSVLQSSSDATIASQATNILNDADRVAAARSHWAEQGLTEYRDQTDPRWRPKEGQKLGVEAKPAPVAAPDRRKIEYLKGTLVSVACGSPNASIKVTSAGKTWTFRTPDYKKLVLIGADDFRCDWKGVKASVNYRSSGPSEGDLVSLEVD
jgi:Flp pilus assembly protein TadD